MIVRATIDESTRPWRRERPGLDGFDHAAPIAGQATVRNGGRIDGLPHLSAYPSLRGLQVPPPGSS